MEKKNDCFEWDWGKELEQYDAETEQYWHQQDLEDSNTDWEQKQLDNKRQFAEMLRGSLGKDMNDVMSGKVVVKLPFKVKFKNWLKRFFSIFS